MANMRDTEGEQIPKSKGYDLFNLTLWNDGMVSMSVPAFATDSGEYTAQGGVLEVSLRDVFDEFLANEDNLINHPDEPLVVANLLREFAAKFEAFAALVASTAPPPPPTAEELQAFEIAASMLSRQLTHSKNH